MKGLLKRYEKYSEQFEKEDRRLSEWLKLLPVGQHPPSYERASTKFSTFPRRKITPLWKQIRSKIVKNNKTLWQHFPWATEDQPPLYREIKPFTKEVIKRKRTRSRKR